MPRTFGIEGFFLFGSFLVTAAPKLGPLGLKDFFCLGRLWLLQPLKVPRTFGIAGFFWYGSFVVTAAPKGA